MATVTLSALRSRLRIYLSDTTKKMWPDDSELDLFLNHAIIKFTTDVPMPTGFVYTVATDQQADSRTYLIPEDMATPSWVRGNFSSTSVEENIERAYLRSGSWVSGQEPLGFIVDYPVSGYLYLPRAPLGSTFTLYYGRFHDSWLDSDQDTFNLGRNRWGELAVMYYAAHLAFNPPAARRAQLEQWNRRSDQNVGNPLEEEAVRWLRLYWKLLEQHQETPTTWEFIRQEPQ